MLTQLEYLEGNIGKPIGKIGAHHVWPVAEKVCNLRTFWERCVSCLKQIKLVSRDKKREGWKLRLGYNYSFASGFIIVHLLCSRMKVFLPDNLDIAG